MQTLDHSEVEFCFELDGKQLESLRVGNDMA